MRDVGVIEMDGELRLDRAAVADVHLAPQASPGACELDLDGSKVGAGHLAMTSDPAFFLETIESATQARRGESEIGGHIERSGTATEALQ